MLKGRNWSELMELPTPPMMIEGLVLRNGLLLLQAYSGVGKTFLALELGIAAASGLPALGKFQVNEPGKVLYVGEDSADWDVKEQVKKLAAAKGLSAKDFDLPWETDEHGVVDLTSGPQFEFVIHEGANLDTDAGAENIIAKVKAIGAKLVILDSLANLNKGNENDNGWMTQVMKRIAKIRPYASVILLHHTSKPNEFQKDGLFGARGAGAIAANLDGALELKPKKYGRIGVKIVKRRAMRLTEFDYELEYDDETAVLRVVEDDDPFRNALKTALAKVKEMTRPEMIEVIRPLMEGQPEAKIAQKWWSTVQTMLAREEVRKVRRGVYAAKSK